jgi:hypothetical protein
MSIIIHCGQVKNYPQFLGKMVLYLEYPVKKTLAIEMKQKMCHIDLGW